MIRRSHARRHTLITQQHANGSWSEEDFTGTGFPGVFYLKYHLYKNSFPVYALGPLPQSGYCERQNIARRNLIPAISGCVAVCIQRASGAPPKRPNAVPHRTSCRFRKTPCREKTAWRTQIPSDAFLDPLGGYVSTP